jgi:hypothetical protein
MSKFLVTRKRLTHWHGFKFAWTECKLFENSEEALKEAEPDGYIYTIVEERKVAKCLLPIS